MSTATTIDWQWADYQADVRDQLESGDVDLVVLRTGYGGGKSITGGQWIHRGAITDRAGDGQSLVMAQDYAKGKSTTYSVFFKTLPGDDTNPFGDGDPENSPIVRTWHSNDKRLTYVTGHTTYLGGADKWSRFAGAEFCRIWCDEVGHYPPTTDLYKLHEMLVTRQRTEVGPNTTLWTSTGNGYNTFYDITERQVNRDEEPLRWADRMHVVTASTEDNPFIPDDGLEKIKAQFDGTAREEQGLHGGFAAAEGLVYNSFTRRDHVIPSKEADDLVATDWRMYAYDAGWKDPRVLLEIGRSPQGQYIVRDCLYASECHVGDPNDIRSGTALHWLDGRPDGVIYAEHVPADIDTFRRAGWHAKEAEKDIDGGIDAVRERLEMSDGGEPGLLIADRCTPLIQEFLSYQEEHVGKDGADDHALDALRYGVFTNSVRQERDRSGGGFARSF